MADHRAAQGSGLASPGGSAGRSHGTLSHAGETLDWTVGTGRSVVQPFILVTRGCFMGVSRVGVHRAGMSPRGRHGAESEEMAPHSTFAPTDADHGGAGGTLTPAGRTPRGRLFQLGDDLRQGLQFPFTLQGQDEEVN